MGILDIKDLENKTMNINNNSVFINIYEDLKNSTDFCCCRCDIRFGCCCRTISSYETDKRACVDMINELNGILLDKYHDLSNNALMSGENMTLKNYWYKIHLNLCRIVVEEYELKNNNKNKYVKKYICDIKKNISTGLQIFHSKDIRDAFDFCKTYPRKKNIFETIKSQPSRLYQTEIKNNTDLSRNDKDIFLNMIKSHGDLNEDMTNAYNNAMFEHYIQTDYEWYKIMSSIINNRICKYTCDERNYKIANVLFKPQLIIDTKINNKKAKATCVLLICLVLLFMAAIFGGIAWLTK